MVMKRKRFFSVKRSGQRGLAMLAALALLFGAGTAAAEEPRVRMTTSLGDIVVELYPGDAPLTVENFLERVAEGFYEGLIFHRVVAGFVIQTGGYDAELTYREPPGNVPNESANGLRNSRGTLAMARLSDPDSANTQFYINVKHNTHLDGAPGRPGYTVFGRVVEGMDVVTEIELSDTGRRGGMAGVPDSPIVIERMHRL
jgi:peptidyl-prolyl cis-trans isomerase A (cyclophilin A)